MDKQTLSNYGWIVVMTLTLSLMISFATPLGRFIGEGINNIALAFKQVISHSVENIEPEKELHDIDLNGSFIITDKEGSDACYVFKMNEDYNAYSLTNGVPPEINDRYFRCVRYVDIEERNDIKELFFLAKKYDLSSTVASRQGIQCALLYYVTGKDYSAYVQGLNSTAKETYNLLLSKNGTVPESKYEKVQLVAIEKDGYIDILAVSDVNVEVVTPIYINYFDSVGTYYNNSEYEYQKYQKIVAFDMPDFANSETLSITGRIGSGRFHCSLMNERLVYCAERNIQSPDAGEIYYPSSPLDGVSNDDLGRIYLAIEALKQDTDDYKLMSQWAIWGVMESSNKRANIKNYVSDEMANLYDELLEYAATIDMNEYKVIVANTPAPIEGVSYIYGDYTYLRHGTEDNYYYSVKVNDKSKSSYTSVVSYINDIPVSDMSGCYAGCENMTSTPSVLSSITEMRDAYRGCNSLTGTVTINTTPTSYSNCFRNTELPITITGSATNLDEIAATGNNGNVSIPVELEITSDATYIDTLIQPDKNTICEYYAHLNPVATSGALFGSYYNSSFKYYVGYTTTSIQTNIGANSSTTDYDISLLTDGYHTHTLKGGAVGSGYFVDGERLTTCGGIQSSYRTLTIGHSNGVAGSVTGKFKTFKMWQSGELVFNGTAVKDGTGTKCLYDSVSDKYFYLDGTNKVVKHVIQKAYYSEGATLSGDENSYIDTGLTGGRYKIEFVGKATSIPSSTASPLACGTSNFYIFFPSSTQGAYNATGTQIVFSNTSLQEHKYYSNGGSTLYVDDVAVATRALADTSGALWLFKASGYSTRPSTIMMRYCKIWDMNDNLLRDYVPAEDEYGDAFFYDKVSGTRYYSTTGSFTISDVGEKVEIATH